MENKCRYCDKKFSLAEALEQHIKVAHPDRPVNSKPSYKAFIYFGLIFIGIIIGYYAYENFVPSTYDGFAQCISSSGAKFYGAFWCPHCQDQKKMFGTAAKYLPYIECSNSDQSENALCSSAGISGYPTWVFADGSRASLQTLQQLSVKTGCALP